MARSGSGALPVMCTVLLGACSALFPDSDFTGGDASVDQAVDGAALDADEGMTDTRDGSLDMRDASVDMASELAVDMACTPDSGCADDEACIDGTCMPCDGDGDGFERVECGAEPADCDDANAAMFPGAAICGDRMVNACDGTALELPAGFPEFAEVGSVRFDAIAEVREAMMYDLSLAHVPLEEGGRVVVTYTEITRGGSVGRLLVLDEALREVRSSTLSVAPDGSDVRHSRSVRREGPNPVVDIALHGGGLLGRANYNAESDMLTTLALDLTVRSAECFVGTEEVNVQAPQMSPLDRIDLLGDGTLFFNNRFRSTLATIPRDFPVVNLRCDGPLSGVPSVGSHGGRTAALVNEGVNDGPDLTIWTVNREDRIAVTRRFGSDASAPVLAVLAREFDLGRNFETTMVANVVPSIGGGFDGDFGINAAVVRCSVDQTGACVLQGEGSLDLRGDGVVAVGAPSASPLFEGLAGLASFERRDGLSTSTDRLVLRTVASDGSPSTGTLLLGEVVFTRDAPVDNRVGESALSVRLDGGIGATVYFGAIARDPNIETRNQAGGGNADLYLGSAVLCEAL
ncbi:MAG: hypothetical protein AAF411_03675 [Myxococcota bacterium]